MAIEKQGTSSEKDIRELVKLADANEKIICYDLDAVLDKPAIAVVATGKRAQFIRGIIEEISSG